MSVKTQVIRFRIWQFANPRGWDVTFNEVAEALGVEVAVVGSIARHAGWVERFRVSKARENLNLGRRSNGAGYYAAHHLASEIVAGRVEVSA